MGDMTQPKKIFKPSTRLCIVDGCTSQVGRHGAKDMCQSHYSKAHNKKLSTINTGLCACGCGLPVANNHTFLHGHWAKANGDYLSRIKHQNSRTPHGDGYLSIYLKRKSVLEHIAIAEKAIGRTMPKGAQVHHVNGDRGDNTNSNLVICQDSAYHQLLHKRERAFDACGNADYLKCPHCKQWDSPTNMYVSPNGATQEHRYCGNEYRKAYYKKQRAEAHA